MAAAVMFGAVACSQYDEQEVVEGQEVTTTFSIGLEDLGTRLAGDSGMIDKVVWGIYDHQADGKGRFLAAHSSDQKGATEFENGKAEIEVTLFSGKKYDLVFFGYCSEVYGTDKAYNIDWQNRKLNVDYEKNYHANLESRDAFVNITNGWTAGVSPTTFILTRPFAQLNVGQSMEDFNNMQLTQNYIEKSSVTAQAYKTMDLANGSVSDLVDVHLYVNDVLNTVVEEPTDQLNDALNVSGVDYKHIAMNYLLVNEKQVVNEVLFHFYENDPASTGNPTTFIRKYYNVPLQRNYRTNILGRIISDEFDFEIVIDANFNEPDNDIFHAFQHGGEVTLPSDMEVGHPLVVRSGVEATLNLNGHTLKNNKMNKDTDLIIVEQGATLTINGDGTLEAVSGNDGYAVISEGTLIINGGTFKSGVDENNAPNAVIYARGNGEVYVNGGLFPNENTSKFVLNKKDADRATTTIEVKGGKFYNFNPEDNAAEGAGTNFVATGYHAEEVEANVWEVIKMTVVHNETELKAALATADVEKIKFANDIDLSTQYLNIEGVVATIYCEGYKLTTSDTTKNYSLYVFGGSDVVINDLVIENRGGIQVYGTSKVVLNNANILANYSTSGRNLFYIAQNSVLTVNSGTYATNRTTCHYFYTESGATLDIKGGTFGDNVVGGGKLVHTSNKATVVISGGTFKSTTRDLNPSAWVASDYQAVKNGSTYVVVEREPTVVSTAAEFNAAIAAAVDGDIIALAAGTYEGLFNLTNKNITIKSTAGAVIDGMVWLDTCAPTFKGLTFTNPNGVQHPNSSNSQYYATINKEYPLVGAYNNSNPRFENCVFNIVAPTVYGYYGYAHNNPVFEGCTFNCNGIRPIASNGASMTVNGCTFVDQYHYSVRIFENSGALQTVVYTNNTVQGTNAKGEFEGINISKKGSSAVVLGNFTIKGNTNTLKYRHHKNVTMSDACSYDTDIANFAFEKED